MRGLTNLPAYPIPHKKYCIPKTGSQIAVKVKVPLLAREPVMGRTPLESVTWWKNGQNHITLLHLIKSLSNQTVHNIDSKWHTTIPTPTQKVNNRLR